MIRFTPRGRARRQSLGIGSDEHEELICTILRGEAAGWTPPRMPVFAPGFLESGTHHGVVPLLYHRLKPTPSWPHLPKSLRDAIESGATYQAALDLHRHHETIRVLNALATRDCPVLLFKGAALACTHYPSRGLRTRVDTDILIRTADVEIALNSLEKLGYEVPRVSSGISTAVSCTSGDHSVDLHWGISNALIFARAFTFDELYRRAAPNPQFTKHTRIPAAVDALLIACVHRAGHLPDRLSVNGRLLRYGDRLIWLYDIHLLASSMDKDQWGEVIALAGEKQLSSFCLDALQTATVLFHSAVPDPVIQALESNQESEQIPLEKLQSHTQFFIADFRVLPSWPERLALLKKRVFPNRAYMRAMYGAENDRWLYLFYLRRALRRIMQLAAGK